MHVWMINDQLIYFIKWAYKALGLYFFVTWVFLDTAAIMDKLCIHSFVSLFFLMTMVYIHHLPILKQIWFSTKSSELFFETKWYAE